MKIHWKGPTLDPSGYGTANRDYVDALNRVGADIAVEPWNFDAKSPEFYGKQGELIETLKDKSKEGCDVVVHHYVPNALDRNTESGKFNVAYNTWETDALPDHWVEKMNRSVDLVLVPSYFNKEVYEKSGVKPPIEVVPHCVDVQEFVDAGTIQISGFENHKKILSVFQWTERKNPLGLLKAYFTEFFNEENVVLVLKTYGSNTSKEQRDKIKSMIQNLKKDLKLDPNKLPPIYLLGDLLTRKQMVSLYNTCDIFALPTRGEGFGLPFAEACAGNCRVAAPKQGGQLDILKPETKSTLCDYQMTPVAHMPWIPNYHALMNWAEPDIIDFRECMRDALELKIDENKPRNFIEKEFNHEKVGRQFVEAIEKHMR